MTCYIDSLDKRMHFYIMGKFYSMFQIAISTFRTLDPYLTKKTLHFVK